MADSRTSTITPPETKYLKDYRAPDFQIEQVTLVFDLREGVTHVRATSQVRREGAADAVLRLDGHDMTLMSVAVDGVRLTADQYQLEDHHLTLPHVPDQFELTIENEFDPAQNTALEGLYVSKGMYCTQCEAEGFRRITYFLDQPDVMATYRVRIEADKTAYPVLLSNGNNIEQGDLADGRHYVVWDDPFPKPSYLFALVAGDLAVLEDHFTTRSGAPVTLRIFVAPEDLDKCPHAMDSLKKAMVWDEQVYGLEYDLDIFNIVAVSHFNMGAMENKSLNIFNTKCVLAKPETATDGDFAAVEAVVAHEYFHNWTGNRVTCRDWFQLSLKEGLTVFRDQEFSADMGSRAVKRIEDVRILRQHQFAEDSGPMAHPIRPDSYMEINNFYTVTVYEKGAEVIRMIHTLLGPEKYRQGIDLYFDRHDGQAVTCDDFVAAMEDASGVDLRQFRLWYSQAGTPEVTVSQSYDAAAESLTLTFRQMTPDTPGQTDKKPLHIPMAVGLIGPDGADIPLQLDGENAPDDVATTRLLSLTGSEQSFTFVGVKEPVVPSLLRGFSAPVKLKSDLTAADRLFLLAHDSDSFNRWEAGQEIAAGLIMELVDDIAAGRPLHLDDGFSSAMGKVIGDLDLDRAFKAEVLSLPSEATLGQYRSPVDVDAIHQARKFVRHALAATHETALQSIYNACQTTGFYAFTPQAVADRRLKNVCLSYLMTQETPAVFTQSMAQFSNADNMTDEIAALSCMVNSAFSETRDAVESFYAKWRDDDLVLDKWFSVQAAVSKPETQDLMRRLIQHPDFDWNMPNRVRSVVGPFCGQNLTCFHDKSGRGYAFLGDVIEKLDPINPQIASRLVQPLGRWKYYDADRQKLMKATLERILALPNLSENTYEIVSKSLK
ncbi:aminopeptidase N [Paremcibacter congregatus]|uniref:Aminopeptidase N n=1 Tax=Paremcibacter congregatus TaxID=2043170 RepID=A0A2G4YM72_9PROT|nr:aminopeptidase N [Paremcibacter congregatus]PHZ83412.1 aminopeptidase N [Paremcibacter congregatus]QDE28120.1 aminopeptidase N [Paremcibacter congregatus]